jgi:putative endonuclease
MSPSGRFTLKRRGAEARGRRGELLAACWLFCKGYRILARRVKTKVGEIDLVARKGRFLVFVEVKARPRLEDALAALTPQSAERIGRAAALWANPKPWARTLMWRFDLVAIAPGRRPRHLADAYRPGAGTLG